MVTEFTFKPTITTAEMQEITGNDAFEYVLLCNKICGAAHYNMQMNIKVVEEEEFNVWMNEQKIFAEGFVDDGGTSTATVNNEVELTMIEQ